MIELFLAAALTVTFTDVQTILIKDESGDVVWFCAKNENAPPVKLNPGESKPPITVLRGAWVIGDVWEQIPTLGTKYEYIFSFGPPVPPTQPFRYMLFVNRSRQANADQPFIGWTVDWVASLEYWEGRGGGKVDSTRYECIDPDEQTVRRTKGRLLSDAFPTPHHKFDSRRAIRAAKKYLRRGGDRWHSAPIDWNGEHQTMLLYREGGVWHGVGIALEGDEAAANPEMWGFEWLWIDPDGNVMPWVTGSSGH